MRIIYLLALLLIIGCSSNSSDSEDGNTNSAVQDSVVVIDTIHKVVVLEDTLPSPEEAQLGFYFEKYGVDGSFMLFDPQEDRYYTYEADRTEEEFLPASTFKILNSLIALETGVIADTNVVLKWDGKDRGNPNWNKDQDMREAFRNSTVWFYQELARRVGQKRMQHYVKMSEYGNENIEGGIDKFWLEGDLRISMRDQLTFLRKLYRNELPFSRSTMEKVKSIMTYLKTEKYTVHAKTGWAAQQNIGWFVGFVIHDYEVEIPGDSLIQDTLRVVQTKRVRKGYYFSTNIDIKEKKDAAAREGLTIDILKSLNII